MLVTHPYVVSTKTDAMINLMMTGCLPLNRDISERKVKEVHQVAFERMPKPQRWVLTGTLAPDFLSSPASFYSSLVLERGITELHGLSGSGKSQLAMYLVSQHLKLFPTQSILWIDVLRNFSATRLRVLLGESPIPLNVAFGCETFDDAWSALCGEQHLIVIDLMSALKRRRLDVLAFSLLLRKYVRTAPVPVKVILVGGMRKEFSKDQEDPIVEVLGSGWQHMADISAEISKKSLIASGDSQISVVKHPLFPQHRHWSLNFRTLELGVIHSGSESACSSPLAESAWSSRCEAYR